MEQEHLIGRSFVPLEGLHRPGPLSLWCVGVQSCSPPLPATSSCAEFSRSCRWEGCQRCVLVPPKTVVLGRDFPRSEVRFISAQIACTHTVSAQMSITQMTERRDEYTRHTLTHFHSQTRQVEARERDEVPSCRERERLSYNTSN